MFNKPTYPDHWEVDPLLKLLNKIKFPEVPEYSDTHYQSYTPIETPSSGQNAVLPNSLAPNTSYDV